MARTLSYLSGASHSLHSLATYDVFFFYLTHVCEQGILSGGRILKITIDPHVGGATIVEGGHPLFILSSGYIGSTLLGGAFVLAGWDTLVAKVLSFVLGVGLIIPLTLVRDKLSVMSPITDPREGANGH